MTPGAGRYRLTASEAVREELRQCQERLAERGLLEGTRDQLMQMVDELTSRPLQWGDPQFRLQAMNLLVCHRAFSPFYVSFAIDEENRIVYLRWVRLMV